MTSIEKRRSSRKNGRHRKHSDGGFSDTSSCGSFLDETDREVSNLTDRAFRSLCIGDEAVYNDSDLCPPSPCSQKDRQIALCHSGQDREDNEREELKRTAHWSFRQRMQQYGQDWMHGRMWGSEIHSDPQWETHWERTQGQVSATFQHPFMEMSQQKKALKEEQLTILSNGAKELSSQQRRSHSRVSSLIRAFNSEGLNDGGRTDGKLRDWNDENSLDKSSLMSMQRELSEFSTSHQHNFNTGHFSPAGLLLAQDSNFCSSEVSAVAHMDAAFMRSSLSKHSILAQTNCTSNFFIHSEFSPFKVWRDHNRFPFQHRQVSGFMHCPEYTQWCETPMYRELSLDTQAEGQRGQSIFQERGVGHRRSLMSAQNSLQLTPVSRVLQKASALEKRCESELPGHYPHRMRTMSLGTDKFPSQRPSTASPTTEMSRRVQETISSVKALQQKIKMMAEQNTAKEKPPNVQETFCNSNSVIPFGCNAEAVLPNVDGSIITAPSDVSHQNPPQIHLYQEADTPVVQQLEMSPQLVEHAPVRAESRGGTPDVRMSSYKSRAPSLLFNLKDNRKRVKSTYSPSKYKGVEMLEKSPKLSVQEQRNNFIDNPDSLGPDSQDPLVEETSLSNTTSQHYGNPCHNPDPSLAAVYSQASIPDIGQNSEYTSRGYSTAQEQDSMVHHPGLTGYMPKDHNENQLANGQKFHENFSYEQSVTENVETIGGGGYMRKPPYRTPEMPGVNVANNNTREYSMSKDNTQFHVNEAVRRESARVDKHWQLRQSKHDHGDESSQESWRQGNTRDSEKLSRKQNIPAVEKDRHALSHQKPSLIVDEFGTSRDKRMRESQHNTATGTKEIPQYAPLFNENVKDVAYYVKKQVGPIREKFVNQKCYSNNDENEIEDNSASQNSGYKDQEYGRKLNLFTKKEKSLLKPETNQRKEDSPLRKEHEMRSAQQKEVEQQIETTLQKTSLFVTNKTSALPMENEKEVRHFAGVTPSRDTIELKTNHVEAEPSKAQPRAPMDQPKADSKVSTVEQIGLDKIKAAMTQQDKVKLANSELKIADQSKKDYNKAEQQSGEKMNTKQTEKTGGKQPEQKVESDKTRERQSGQIVADQTGVKTEQVQPQLAQRERVRGQQVEPQHATVDLVEKELKNAEQIRIDNVKTDETNPEQRQMDQYAAERLKDTQQKPLAKIEQVEKDQVKSQLAQKERIENKEVKAMPIRAELVEGELRKAEKIRKENVKEHQTQAERAEGQKMKLPVVKQGQEKTKVAIVKPEPNAEDVREKTAVAGQVNAEKLRTEIRKAKEMNAEVRIPEQTIMEFIKGEYAKKVHAISAKATTKVAESQKAKSEMNKVEQVKTELAKAKAELAKIKDKMRDEHQQKVRNTAVAKEDDILKKAKILEVNVKQNDKYQEAPETQTSSRDRTDPGYVDYENPTSIDDITRTGTIDTHSKHEQPTIRIAESKTKNEEEVGRDVSIKTKESHYVYSESSKEFKLSSGDYFSTTANIKTNTDTINSDKDVFHVEKCDSQKPSDVSQRRTSEDAKPIERKSKSSEHSLVYGKDPNLTPSRALSHKERILTKQEILTSKIKAHAEKEISAIKEKGFAMLDEFTSKNPTRHSGSQNINIRHRPQTQEVSRINGNMLLNNITPKHQVAASGAEPVVSASLPSSITTTGYTPGQLQKQVHKEPMKRNVIVPELALVGSLKEHHKEYNNDIKSETKNKEQALSNSSRKQEARREDIVDETVVSADQPGKKKMNPSEATMKREQIHDDSLPSLKADLGQSHLSSVVDDSLQIKGIMVTVREGMNNDQNIQVKAPAQEIGQKTACPEKCHVYSVPEPSKENESLTDAGRAMDKIIMETPTTLKEYHAKTCVNNHSKNIQEAPATENRKNNMSDSAADSRTIPKNDTYINARPLKEIPLQDHLPSKDVHSAVAASFKNSETQHLNKPHKVAREMTDHSNKMPKGEPEMIPIKCQEMTDTEEKNTQMLQTRNKAHTAHEVIAETESNQDLEVVRDKNLSSGKEDITTDIKPAGKLNGDEKSAPLRDQMKLGSTFPMPSDKTSIPCNFIVKKSSHASPQSHNEETHPGEKGKPHSDRHIDNIEISVMGAGTEKDKQKIPGKYCKTNVSDLVEHVTLSTTDDKKVTSLKEIQTKLPNQTNCEKQMKDKEGLGARRRSLSSVRQSAESMKIHDQNHSVNKMCGHGEVENGKTENVQKHEATPDIQKMEEDYFQVHGMAEINNLLPNNSTDITDMSDVVSSGQEYKHQIPKKAEINSDSYKTDEKPSARNSSTRLESCSVSTDSENMRAQTSDASDERESDHVDCSTAIQSGNHEKMEIDQSAHTRKPHAESRASSATRERLNLRHSQPTRENVVTEKPEIKMRPKERPSTVPEISAIADYARLKVIVTDDRESTIQEFPPNKKEGFFPLIKSRHSRRPLFTADPQEQSVKEKSLPSKMEVVPKVNKEPKPIVFPITEKEHQRTGMFKLGEKEKQEMLLDVKHNECASETGAKQVENLKDGHRSPQVQIKNQETREKVPEVGIHRVSQVDRRGNQPSSQVVQIQATSSPPSTNKAKDESAEQALRLVDASAPDEKTGDSSSVKRRSYLDFNSEPQPHVEHNSNIKDNKMNMRKDERAEDQDTVIKIGEEAKVNPQDRGKPLQEIHNTWKREERRAEDRRIKHLTEESGASVSEEQREAAERRAREREAKVIEIKQRREKQKEAERIAEEERKAKQLEENRAAQRMKDIAEQRRKAEERREKLREEEKRIKEIDERKRLRRTEEGRVAGEEQQKQAELHDEQSQAKHIVEDRVIQRLGERRNQQSQLPKRREQKSEEQERERHPNEECMRREREPERRVEKETAIAKTREEEEVKEDQAGLRKEMRSQKEPQTRAKQAEEKPTSEREEEMTSQTKEQKRAAQMMDALQYYAINSAESRRNPRDSQPQSPLIFHKRIHATESTESDFHRRSHRPPAPPSPSPSLPRSNTSSPALGAKPSMFRVKDNTTRGPSFAKSVKPRFYKSIGEDFRVGSPSEQGSGRGEEDPEMVRHNAGTPIHPDTAKGSHRLGAIKESSIFQPGTASQDYSATLRHLRPYTRRSFALDDDDSRSVVSNMSEGVDSNATSAADMGDVRGPYDCERPESACSFSSDVSRLGKPPAVPPKSEKALRRAQRLTTRRVRKELAVGTADSQTEKLLPGVSGNPSSSSTEVWSSNRHAVASPHFAPPVSLTHAPTPGSCLPSAQTEKQLSRRSSLASTHATSPISHSDVSSRATPVSPAAVSAHANVPVPLSFAPHYGTPLSLPVTSPHATAPVSPQVASATASPLDASPLGHSVTIPVASPCVTGPLPLPVATAPIPLAVATAPVPLPVASTLVSLPCATAPNSIQLVSTPASGPISQHAALKTVPHVPSSPTLFYANHPAPVTQYHVETSYPHAYSLTQRKVLQDFGSGQYFVVDAPVQMKLKTFFDPETGKYVQLNVHESGQNVYRPQTQQIQSQPQLQPHLQVKQQLLSQASLASKPYVIYHGYHRYPHAQIPAVVPSLQHRRASTGSTAPVSLSQEERCLGDSDARTNQISENGQNSEVHCYSPEQTPYMDTVNDTNKNRYGSSESFPECGTNSQLAESMQCADYNSGHSRCQPRDIITMSELEDFMEMSDW